MSTEHGAKEALLVVGRLQPGSTHCSKNKIQVTLLSDFTQCCAWQSPLPSTLHQTSL